MFNIVFFFFLENLQTPQLLKQESPTKMAMLGKKKWSLFLQELNVEVNRQGMLC